MFVFCGGRGIVALIAYAQVARGDRVFGTHKRGQPGDQVAPGSFGVDPFEQFSDLVPVQFTPAGQPPQPVLLLAVLLAVRGVHVPGDAEHPGPRGALGADRRTRSG